MNSDEIIAQLRWCYSSVRLIDVSGELAIEADGVQLSFNEAKSLARGDASLSDLLQLERQCRVDARRAYENYPAHGMTVTTFDHCVDPWINQHHSLDHSFGLFLLSDGRPLRFVLVIHFGGRPRRRPRPRQWA